MTDDRAKIHVRWGIIGSCGLYIGQNLTRKDAIERHVQNYDADLWYSRLRGEERQQRIRKIWKECQKRGDRAVKLEIRVLG